MKQTKKGNTTILIVNIIALIILLVLLLFLIQKATQKDDISSIEKLAEQALIEKNIRELYTEAKTEKPYYATHPEELIPLEVKFDAPVFYNINEKGELETNKEKIFRIGDPVNFYITVRQYLNPKITDNYYLFGVEGYVETSDEKGNQIASMTSKTVDISNHFTKKNEPITIHTQLIPDSSVKTGEYNLRFTVKDRISGLNTTLEDKIIIE